MDLLQISRKIWRYRIVTLPVLALTLFGALYVVALKEPEYSASSSYVLINPPAPPTAEDIARNPALARINPENPYTRFTDQSVIVGLLSSGLNNESARQALSNAGADRRYTVAPSSDLGYSSQLIEVTGVGGSPGEAIRTAELVGAALTRELNRLQASQGVVLRYRIETQVVVAPDHAEQRLSGKLRPLVGVFIMGAILLFLVISVAEALTTLRAERGKQDVPKDRQRSSEGANVSRAREWLRGLRGAGQTKAGQTKEVTREKDNHGSFEGAGTNNSPARERQRRPRRARSKEAVQDEEESIEEKDRQGSFEGAGTNNSPTHERQRRPRRARSKG